MLVTASRAPSITAFGAEAERIVRRCNQDVSLLACDGTNVAEAMADAVRRRREGDQYLVMPIVEEPLVALTKEAARSILLQMNDSDQRRQLFEALAFGQLHMNGALITEQQIYPLEVIQSLRELSQMGDGLYVRSHTERMRLESLFGRKRLYVAAAPLLDPNVPDVRPYRGAREVVVWAPEASAEELCVFSYGLWHLKRPAIFVCRGSIAGAPHHFIDPSQAESALREAAVIVDTQSSDPGTALAFADRGYGVASAMSTGAYEYMQASASYYMHDFSSIHGAVTRARADRRTFTFAFPDASRHIVQTIAAAQPQLPEVPPLVSIIVPTYNRLPELRRNLESFAKQTYPNFEVLVVNDCGEDASHIVAEFPFARYLCTPKNLGCCGAVNFALRAARGEYSACIADDDRDYPTFISSLVAAAVASDVDVAHGNIALRLDTTLPDGRSATYAHMVDHDADHDAAAALWGNMLHQQGFLIRHTAFEDVGFLDESLYCAADVDIYIKLAKHYDFAHVTCVVGEMSYRDDKSNFSSQIGSDLEHTIGGVLHTHAPAGSELTAARIEQTIQGAAEGSRRAVFFTPWTRLQYAIPI